MVKKQQRKKERKKEIILNAGELLIRNVEISLPNESIEEIEKKESEREEHEREEEEALEKQEEEKNFDLKKIINIIKREEINEICENGYVTKQDKKQFKLITIKLFYSSFPCLCWCRSFTHSNFIRKRRRCEFKNTTR